MADNDAGDRDDDDTEPGEPGEGGVGELGESDDEDDMSQLKNLLDYTKFHMGVYLTLFGILVTAIEKNFFPAHPTAVVVALVLFVLAGAAGGMIGASIPDADSFEEFRDADLRPRVLGFLPEWAGLKYGVLAGAEHLFFWLGIATMVFIVFSGPGDARKSASTTTSVVQQSGERRALVHLLSIGSFGDASTSLQTGPACDRDLVNDWGAAAERLHEVVRTRRSPNDSVQLLIIPVVDSRPLSARARQQFGSNDVLAAERGASAHARLALETRDLPIIWRISPGSGAPDRLAARGDAICRDRRVDIYEIR